jgi:replicative DNA helicase
MGTLNTTDILSDERYLCGAICISAETVIPAIIGTLTPDDFSDPVCKSIYTSAMALREAGKTIDPVTVKNASFAAGVEITDAQLRTMMADVPTLVNVPDYVGRVADAADARRLASILDDAASTLILGGKVDDVRTNLAEAITQTRATNGLVTSAEAMTACYKELMDIQSGKQMNVLTGYSDLDKLLGGLKKSGLYYLAARPGCGKTTTALQIAEAVAESGVDTVFISLEMSLQELSEKRLTMATGLTSEELHKPTKEQWKLISESSKELYKTRLSFNKIVHMSVPLIERLARQGHAGLVVIDYLGLLQHNEGKSTYEKVTATSNALKRMAMALNIPVLCLCQLNRQAANKEPQLQELRDSGAIEQDGDGVMLLHLTDRPDGDTPAELKMIVAKNRHGATGVVNFYWWLKNGRIKQQAKEG